MTRVSLVLGPGRVISAKSWPGSMQLLPLQPRPNRPGHVQYAVNESRGHDELSARYSYSCGQNTLSTPSAHAIAPYAQIKGNPLSSVDNIH